MRPGVVQRAFLTVTSLAAVSGCTAITDDAVSSAPVASSPSTVTPSPSHSEPAGKLVTETSQLAGRWQADYLLGQRVAQPTGPTSHPVDVVFTYLSGNWWWSTNDGCNSTGGRFSVTVAGKLTTGAGVSTLVGCPSIPGAKEHAANNKALEIADEAWIDTSAGHQPPELTLVSEGEVVAVYTAGYKEPADG